MAGGSRTLKLTILGDVDNLNKSLKAANNDVENSSSKISEFGKKAGIALAAAAAAAGAMAIKIGVDAVKSASNLSETISKVSVLFGDGADAINEFAATAASKLGQTKQQALDAAATFATFGKAAGLTGQDLVKFSTGFTALASDLASFNNTSPEQAINAIGSALRGEAEPLRAYGVLLDDASLRQAALELGIINTTKNALTPQQKVLAAQELIYKQTGAAQGDFARTSDGLANQTRILSAQMENAKTTIGTALLPVVLQMTTFFSKNVLPVIEQVAGAFSNKTGGLGEAFSTIGGIIKGYVTPIFEGMISVFNNIKKAVVDNIDNFKDFLDVVKFIAPVIGELIGASLKVIAPIANAVIDIFGAVLGAVKPMINGLIDGINLVIRGLNIINPFKDIPYLPKMGTSGSGTSSQSSAGGYYDGSTFVPPTTTKSTPTPTITIPKSDISVPASKASAKNSQDLANFTAGQNAASERLQAQADAYFKANPNIDPLTGGMKQILTPSESAKQLAANQGLYSPITINIGIAGDPEATARTIVDTVNNSFYRGTGGADRFALASI